MTKSTSSCGHVLWTLTAFSLLVLSILLASFQAEAVAPHIRDVVVFKGGEGGTDYYRIPSMVVATDGSLVAFAEGRPAPKDPGGGSANSIKSRRSTDNGVTWSDYQTIAQNSKVAYSDPRPLVDQSNGRVFIFYTQWDKSCAKNNNCVPFDDPLHKLLYRTSDDNGQTWSDAIDVLDQVKDVNWYANGSNNILGKATWSATPSQSQIDRAVSDGWSLDWRSRAADGSCNVQYFGNGNKRFLADLQVNADKSIKAVLWTDGGKLVFPLGFDISAYHDYRLVGNGSTASFYVDNALVTSHWQGQTDSSKTVTWGFGCKNKTGGSAYHNIEFAIAGEPLFQFDASLMKRVNGKVINHPAEQGWHRSRTGSMDGKGDPGWKSVGSGPGHGIQLASGRLIFPAIVRDAFTQSSVVSIYSDDHGVTWSAGNQTPTFAIQPTEADMVQLNDGRILLSARNDGPPGEGHFNRYQFISSNEGVSWTRVQEERDSVNGTLFYKLDQVDTGLERYGKDRILLSGPQGKSAVSSERYNLAIWSAFDDGAGNYNFTERTQFQNGYSGYSDLIKLQDKGVSGHEDVGVIYEAKASTEIRLMVIDINHIQ